MNCIVVDDDRTASMALEKLIQKVDFLNLLKVFNSPIEAINFLNSDNVVDLIFLDVEMPEMTGIEFLKNITDLPSIIIVSAKEKYAIEAIEYDIVDYLVKPTSYVRFFKAVSKANNQYKNKLQIEKNIGGLFVKNSPSTYIRLDYDQILWIEALENYVVINTYDEKHTVHFTMKLLTKKLPLSSFYRIHRSYIVNISKIHSIEDNNISIKTATGIKSIPIAKSYKEELLKKLNIIAK